MSTQIYAVGGDPVTVRDPEPGARRERIRIQSEKRTLDASMKQHIAGIKWRWHLQWNLLTTTEYGVLIAELERQTSLTFSPPHTASTFTVVVIGDIPIVDRDVDWHDVSATLEQV